MSKIHDAMINYAVLATGCSPEKAAFMTDRLAPSFYAGAAAMAEICGAGNAEVITELRRIADYMDRVRLTHELGEDS
jgi:hypothetical protein